MKVQLSQHQKHGEICPLHNVRPEQVIALDVVVAVKVLRDALEYLLESTLQGDHLEVRDEVLLDVVEGRPMAAWILGLSLYDIRAIVEDNDANKHFLVVLNAVEANAPELLLTGRELFSRALILRGVEQPLRVGIRARCQL